MSQTSRSNVAIPDAATYPQASASAPPDRGRSLARSAWKALKPRADREPAFLHPAFVILPFPPIRSCSPPKFFDKSSAAA